jgi:deoxyribodipyrimidine photolyase
MSSAMGLFWFRRDLCLADNAEIDQALNAGPFVSRDSKALFSIIRLIVSQSVDSLLREHRHSIQFNE